jgi:Tfp pilus assembly protein PilX
MQVACNRTAEAHPSGSVASSMEAQAHTSCNRRAGYYVQENCTATCANAAPSRLRNQCRDSRQPCAWPNSANQAHRSRVSQPREETRRLIWPKVDRQ